MVILPRAAKRELRQVPLQWRNQGLRRSHLASVTATSGATTPRSSPAAPTSLHRPDPTIVEVTLFFVAALAKLRVPSWRLNS